MCMYLLSYCTYIHRTKAYEKNSIVQVKFLSTAVQILHECVTKWGNYFVQTSFQIFISNYYATPKKHLDTC